MWQNICQLGGTSASEEEELVDTDHAFASSLESTYLLLCFTF